MLDWLATVNSESLNTKKTEHFYLILGVSVASYWSWVWLTVHLSAKSRLKSAQLAVSWSHTRLALLEWFEIRATYLHFAIVSSCTLYEAPQTVIVCMYARTQRDWRTTHISSVSHLAWQGSAVAFIMAVVHVVLKWWMSTPYQGHNIIINSLICNLASVITSHGSPTKPVSFYCFDQTPYHSL